jgi:CBS domain-containing protein
MFPVVEAGKLIGCITTRHVKEVPREQWAQHPVKDVVEPCSQENTIDWQADAIEGLSKMNRVGASRLMVTDNDNLQGVISLKDIMGLISLKLELEGE